MAAPEVAAPPPGFVLEAPVTAAPPPPPGFTLEQAGTVPPPPSGFVIEAATPSPAAPAAPGSPGPARDPLVASAAPALAAPPPVTPQELDAQAARLGVSPETAPAGPVAGMTPLPPASPELRDESRGFLNNLTVRDLLNAPRTGAAGNVARWLAGNTDAERARRRRALGQDVDPIERELLGYAEAAYQRGGYDAPEYRQVDQALRNYLKTRDNPEFRWADLRDAIAADPGGMGAELVKALVADPELAVVPLGWTKAAQAAGALAKTAGAGRAAAAAARIAAGATGAAATGAALQAPISVAQQLGEGRPEIDWSRVGRETAVAGAVSAPTAGLFVGAGATLRALRRLRGRPGADAEAIDGEIAQTMKDAEAEAVRAGMSPETARAELERFAVDVESGPGGAVVRPRTAPAEALPGETAATPRPALPEPRAVTDTTTPPPARSAGGAAEYERLARATDDPVIRQELLRQAELARQAAAGVKRKLTPAERHREAMRVDLETDDVLTAIRKLGGIDVRRARQVDLEDLTGKADDFKLREPGPDELPARAPRVAAAGRGAEAVSGPQLELFLSTRAPQAEHVATLETFGRRVRHVKTGTFPSALTRVRRPEDVAHAVAPLRKQAQESMLAVVTDEAGNILRIGRAHTGTRITTPVDPGIIAGIAANTPGARKVWFVHNHPGGNAAQSSTDEALTGALHELLRGSGVDPQGMVVVAPGGRYTYYHPGGGPHPGIEGEGRLESRDLSGQADTAIPAGRRRHALPVSERNLTGLMRRLPQESIETAADMERRFRALGDREGVLLLDSRHRPVGFLPMTAAEMRELRRGAGGPAQRLLAAIDETNPGAMAARVKAKHGSNKWTAATGNLQGFAKSAGLRLLDVLDTGFEPARGAMPDQTTFYANPFLHAAGEIARDIGVSTGRNLTAAAAGGAFAGVSSNEEAGSARWWLDVAAGATAGILGSQFLRRTNLVGKGSIIDNWRARAGDWIEGLPLIGRGPEELRDLKRKQRLMQEYLDRQTAEVGKHLLDNFSPAERAMMADLIETRGIVKDLNVIHRQAQALDDYLAYVGERMKALKMLPEELETGGYLHRYYAKHLGLDRLFKEAKGQSLSGSYTIARGTDDTFRREYFSPAASAIIDEFEQLRATIDKLERRPPGLLAADTTERLSTLKARMRELSKMELREYLGQENGAVRSFLFAGDEVARVPVEVGRPRVERAQPGENALDTRTLPQAPVTDLKPTDRRWRIRGVKAGEALLHRDWTKAERQSWGEIEDAGYRYVRGMLEASHDLSLATLYDRIARNDAWARAEPPADARRPWVFVPKTKVGQNSPLEKYGALAGQYVRPDVWAGIKNYGRNPLRGGPKIPGTGATLGEAYLAALNKWKLYKTVYNPVTHFNNSYSNVEMLYMGGYSPADVASGLKHMLQGEKSAIWREARDAGLFGSDWTTSLLSSDGHGSQALADLAEQLRTQPQVPDAMLVTSLMMDVKDWWIRSGNALAQADGAWKTGAALAEAMARPVLRGVGFTTKPVKAAARAMQRAYRFEDNVFKMAVFAAERAKGSSVRDALDAGERLFFDYQDLPEAIKLARDLPVGSPFVAYPYFAVQAIARNVAQNPERVLALVAGYEAINYAVLAADGLAPGEYWATESAEDATAPPWDRGRALWGARNTVHMPFMEGYRLALGRAHALGNPFMSEAGGREKLPEVPYGANFWGSSMFGGSPLHALLDVSVNEDWKGKKIYAPGAPAEEKSRKIAAYLYQAWAPSNPLQPGGYQQTKILEGLANDVRTARAEGRDPGLIAPVVDAANATSEALGFGQFTGLDRADNEILTRDALLASFGVKLRPIRVEQSVEFETGKLEQEKRKLADWFKERSRLNAEGRITDAQFAEDERALDMALERLDREQDTLFDAEAFLRKRTPTTPRTSP